VGIPFPKEMRRFAYGRRSSSAASLRPITHPHPLIQPRVETEETAVIHTAAIRQRKTPKPHQNRKPLPPIPAEPSPVIPAFLKQVRQLDRKEYPECERLSKIQAIPARFDSNYTDRFVWTYMRETSGNLDARVVREACRAYLRKVKWRRRICMELARHAKLLRLVLLTWRLASASNPKFLLALHSQFSEAFDYLRPLCKPRRFAPFRFFYLSGRLFVPKGYDARLIFHFIYLMSCPDLHRVVANWLRAAQLRRQHREKLLFVTFSHKKWRQFKPVYNLFQIWQRFTKWKRIGARNPHGKFISLPDPEANVTWKVRENALNARRARQLRADQASNKRIAAKAVRALYNLSIMTMARHAVLDRSDRFRNRHSQALGHRAWLRFMQQRSRENQFLRDVMRAWYSRVYRVRKWRVMTNLGDNLRLTYHLRVILDQWYRVTQLQKYERTQGELKIHAMPSPAYAVVFLLRGDYELFFSALCFRSWLRFGRARARWKRFLQWTAEPKADREAQHLVLCELKRAAQFKLVQRMFTERPKFFPRKPFMSLEMTLKHIEEDREEENKNTAN
jgi:hypothetical protein